MSDSMWTRCTLEGAALDAKVAALEGVDAADHGHGFLTVNHANGTASKWSPSTAWAQGGPIIERDHIFLDPPRSEHVHGGPNAGWHHYLAWTATVSARTRTKPGTNHVGRGAGLTPLIAAMRAYVDSKS